MVKELLAVGAKATDENAEGYRALDLAAKKGHVNVLRALREQSTAYWKVCSRRIGLTALHVAAAFGQTEFVSEMLPIVPATIKSERPLIDPSGDVCFFYFVAERTFPNFSKLNIAFICSVWNNPASFGEPKRTRKRRSVAFEQSRRLSGCCY